jgi:hypothetical protein
VRETLKTLPKGYAEIHKAYDAVVAKIKSQGGDWTVLAEKALSWILLARRKITMFELQHGLTVKIHHPGGAVAGQTSSEEELDEEEIDDEEESHEKLNNLFEKSYINRSHEIISACSGLITIDQETNHVRLVHYTAQKYFEKRKSSLSWLLDRENRETEITEVCLAYLLFDSPCPPGLSGKATLELEDLSGNTQGDNIDWDYDSETSNHETNDGEACILDGSFPTEPVSRGARNSAAEAISSDDSGDNLGASFDREEMERGAIEKDETTKQEMPLLEYAAGYWAVHARHAKNSYIPLALEFLSNDAKLARAVRAHVFDSPKFNQNGVRLLDGAAGWKANPETFTASHFIAYFGLAKLIPGLQQRELPLNTPDYTTKTPLMVAADQKQLAVVEELLKALPENGDEANRIDLPTGCTPLIYVSWLALAALSNGS